MIRKIVCLFACLFSISSFSASCPQAVATDSPVFCGSFKSVAECHCTSSGLPKGMCTNMKVIYDRMNIIYGTMNRACEAQHDTSVQNCIDDWNCYRLGGTSSQGTLCSGTGSPCE